MNLNKGLFSHAYWKTGSEPGSVFKGADFGHYGMTRHRFQDILKCFSFVPPHVEGTCTDVSNYTKLYMFLGSMEKRQMLH